MWGKNNNPDSSKADVYLVGHFTVPGPPAMTIGAEAKWDGLSENYTVIIPQDRDFGEIKWRDTLNVSFTGISGTANGSALQKIVSSDSKNFPGVPVSTDWVVLVFYGGDADTAVEMYYPFDQLGNNSTGKVYGYSSALNETSYFYLLNKQESLNLG